MACRLPPNDLRAMITRIYVTDFDGTLTVSDSMFGILRYHRGMTWLVTVMLLMLPMLVLMKLGVVTNHRTKEVLLSFAFKGINREQFKQLCQRYAEEKRTALLRQTLYQELLQKKAEGHAVVVVSASPEEWVSAIVPEFEVIGTQLQYRDNCFTGRFSTPNCYGQEKVHRLLEAHGELREQRQECFLTAYGDSRGDHEMLMFADKAVIIK